MFASLDQAFSWLEGFANFEKKPYNLRDLRLERMHSLLERFGNPERGFEIVHVAGSKGKGSTSLYLARLIEAAGYKVGLYSSPHVQSYRERITLAGRFVPEDVLLGELSAVRDRMETLRAEDFAGGLLPTFFELITLLAFLVFRRLDCRWLVLETGLGGRLDATNVTDKRAAVITPIELEHTEYLGNSLAEIAGEKAGILRRNTPCFVSKQAPEAMEVFRERSSALESPFFSLDDGARISIHDSRIDGTDITIQLADGFAVRCTLSMLGNVQPENAALALSVVHTLLPDLKPPQAARALADARLSARFELVSTAPPVVVDGSHTPQSALRLRESFQALFPAGGILVLALVSGKRHAEIAAILCPAFTDVIVTTPGTWRASDPGAVYEAVKTLHPRVQLVLEHEKALAQALAMAGTTRPVLVAGSFYLAGEILYDYQRLHPEYLGVT